MSDTLELWYAHMESDRAIAEKNYFAPRKADDTELNRRMFRAGFERAHRLLWRDSSQEGRLMETIVKTRQQLLTVVEPWVGVRADIIPPAVSAAVVLCNDLHAAITQSSGEPECRSISPATKRA